MSRYTDETWAAIKRAGCTMIFFGAESGSDWVLEEMQKGITTRQTLEIARRTRQFGIIPEFSFVIGNPNDPDRDTGETLRFIRKIKRVNPDSEIIIQHYTPTPQPHKAGGEMYGNIEVAFPDTPAGWATPEWMNYTLRIDTNAPWLKRKTKQLIDNFEIVVASRWPTVQDIRAPRWSRLFLKALSAWRYRLHIYSFPFELHLANQFIALRKPKRESLLSFCLQPPHPLTSSTDGPKSMTIKRILCSGSRSVPYPRFCPLSPEATSSTPDAVQADGSSALRH
jgi:radical SAM superfamily enzyme YgiQ (UPF0313 family)